MSVTPIAGRALERHERQFLALVARHLRDVPRARRDDALRAATDHLVDRPPTPDEAALWEAVGTPTAYAAELRITHGLGAERTDWWARWIAIPRTRRWIGVTLTLLLAAATVAGVATYRWWVDWDATIYSNGFGATWADGRADVVNGIERIQTMHSSEVTVPARDGDALHIDILLTSTRPITVEDVSLVMAPMPDFTVDGIETAPMTGGLDYRPFAPFRLADSGAPPDHGQWVRFRIGLNSCEHYGPSSGPVIERIAVRYHALGRDRTAVLPLLSPVLLRC